MDANPNQQQINQVQVPVGQFAGMMRSKKEVYLACVFDAKFYLPDYHTCSLLYLRDLISGNRQK